MDASHIVNGTQCLVLISVTLLITKVAFSYLLLRLMLLQHV